MPPTWQDPVSMQIMSPGECGGCEKQNRAKNANIHTEGNARATTRKVLSERGGGKGKLTTL